MCSCSLKMCQEYSILRVGLQTVLLIWLTVQPNLNLLQLYYNYTSLTYLTQPLLPLYIIIFFLNPPNYAVKTAPVKAGWKLGIHFA